MLSALEDDRLSVAWTPSRSTIIRYSNMQALIRLETKSDWKAVADKDGVSDFAMHRQLLKLIVEGTPIKVHSYNMISKQRELA